MRCAETSVESFHSLSVARYLQPKEQAVLDAFNRADGKPLTRQQISYLTGMALHSVCGRVRSLLDKKAIVVTGRTVDSLTRKPQELLGLPVLEQGDLFK